MKENNSKAFLLILLGALTAFGPLVTDMYDYDRIFRYKFVIGTTRTHIKYDRVSDRADFFRPVKR